MVYARLAAIGGIDLYNIKSGLEPGGVGCQIQLGGKYEPLHLGLVHKLHGHGKIGVLAGLDLQKQGIYGF